MRLIKNIVFVNLVGWFMACAHGKPEADIQSLYGYWVLEKATRSNRLTETLTGTYFHFLENGKMKTNLPVSETEETTFVFDGTVITQNAIKKLEYHVPSLSDSTLILEIEIRAIPFKMYFRKSPTPSVESNTLMQ
jgi:hypothetical protein